MANALQNPHRDDRSTHDRVSAEARIAEIEAIAQTTESQVRTWGWLCSLSEAAGDRRIDAIVYPSTMAGAASLVNRLESSGIEWQPVGQTDGRRLGNQPSSVAISLRLLDEHLIFDDDRIRVHAGYSVSALAYAATERGLQGLELLSESRGGLGDFLRPGRHDQIWRFVEEIVIAKHGTLKIILTRGQELTVEQRNLVEGSLILAATLRLSRRGVQAFPNAVKVDENRGMGDVTGGELIPLSERMRDRVARELQLELEYDVDVWRDEAEDGRG